MKIDEKTEETQERRQKKLYPHTHTHIQSSIVTRGLGLHQIEWIQCLCIAKFTNIVTNLANKPCLFPYAVAGTVAAARLRHQGIKWKSQYFVHCL